jgi:tetratricopeptide (TPR) repeat protein
MRFRPALRLLLAAAVSAAALAACDLVDPTGVRNPNVGEDDFLDFPDPMASWLRGMERQMALALNNQNNDLESSYLATAEIASDNYVNTATFFNQFMDDLTIDPADDDVEIPLREFHDLRSTALFGLRRVAAADETTTDDQLAELHFFNGVAHLYIGEIWHLAPADSGGAPVPSADHFARAAAAFDQAVALTSSDAKRAGYQTVLARAYRNLGDRAGARAAAEAALAADPDVLRFASYDFINNPENDMQLAIFGRPQNDLQPLPRLDVLDPKFFNSAEPNSVDDQYADIAFVKAEEAYLILAEAQLADGDLDDAKATLGDLLGLVASRPRRALRDADDPRENQDGSARPDAASWRVAAAPGAPFRDGLVRSRTESVPVPVISGTTVSAADVDALDDLDDALRLLYLLRQEVFIAEGRRMMDLGVRWPVPQDEILVNENINEGDPATEPVVPAFLPADEMDAFTVDADAQTVTVLHDLNAVLVENKASPLVLPFH